MTDTIYLVFNRSSVDRMLKTDRNLTLGRGERVVRVQFTAPDSLWQPLPELRVLLQIESQHASEQQAVTLDPQQSPSMFRGDKAQASVNLMAAQLIEKCLQTTWDSDLRKLALESIALCKEMGVVVKVEVPSGEAESE